MISRFKWPETRIAVVLPLLYLLIVLLVMIYTELNLVKVGGFELTCQSTGLCGLGAIGQWFAGSGADLHRLVQMITWPSISLLTGLTLFANRKRGWKRGSRLLLLTMLVSTGQAGVAWFRIRAISDPTGIVINQGLIVMMVGAVILAALEQRVGGPSMKFNTWRAYGSRRTRYFQLVLWTTLIVFVAMLTGALATAGGGSQACAGWPLCQQPSANLYVWIQMVHRGVSAVAAVMVGWIALRAWRQYRTNVEVMVAATSAGVLYAAQGLIGAVQAGGDAEIYFTSLHSSTSIAIWGVLIFLLVRLGYYEEAIQAPGQATNTAPRSLRDFLLLTKPIVVLLLLFTTYGGMVVAGQAWPGLNVTWWTLAGGALAAGGSSAVNQYIDRDRDKLMVRTAKRPIAAGRLTPAEGLAFGAALCLVAFYILAVFVNLLAALLAVAGMFYYVVLYSLFLKHATVQNIVIGGGAGAIPPLVGWAAVTGNISWAAMTLFAVIFLWTPPHFWALAIVKRKDYANAEVPMLPVVRGEKETRWQIFLYTLILVGFTLTLPLFGLGAGIYLGGAILLGVWLIRTAGKVWQGSGNKVAWKMYRHSSMYLAFLFFALMIDAVV